MPRRGTSGASPDSRPTVFARGGHPAIHWIYAGRARGSSAATNHVARADLVASPAGFDFCVCLRGSGSLVGHPPLAASVDRQHSLAALPGASRHRFERVFSRAVQRARDPRHLDRIFRGHSLSRRSAGIRTEQKSRRQTFCSAPRTLELADIVIGKQSS
jgi:hypothetical protein